MTLRVVNSWINMMFPLGGSLNNHDTKKYTFHNGHIIKMTLRRMKNLIKTMLSPRRTWTTMKPTMTHSIVEINFKMTFHLVKSWMNIMFPLGGTWTTIQRATSVVVENHDKRKFVEGGFLFSAPRQTSTAIYSVLYVNILCIPIVSKITRARIQKKSGCFWRIQKYPQALKSIKKYLKF